MYKFILNNWGEEGGFQNKWSNSHVCQRTRRTAQVLREEVKSEKNVRKRKKRTGETRREKIKTGKKNRDIGGKKGKWEGKNQFIFVQFWKAFSNWTWKGY